MKNEPVRDETAIETYGPLPSELTLEQQLNELRKPVPREHMRKAAGVKGPYVTGDYVVWRLNVIFGPHCWSFSLIESAQLVCIHEQPAYARATGHLTVTFADGSTATQDVTGVTPVPTDKALSHESALHGVCTDCLKGAAERLGMNLRPMSDLLLENRTRAQYYAVTRTQDQGPEDAAAALFGGNLVVDAQPQKAPRPPEPQNVPFPMAMAEALKYRTPGGNMVKDANPEQLAALVEWGTNNDDADITTAANMVMRLRTAQTVEPLLDDYPQTLGKWNDTQLQELCKGYELTDSQSSDIYIAATYILTNWDAINA